MIRLCSLLLLLFSITGCIQKNEPTIEEAVAQYREKNGSETGVLARVLMQSSSTHAFKASGMQNQGQCLFVTKGKILSVVSPFTFDLETEKGEELDISCGISDIAVSRNGEIIDMFNPDGEKISSYILDNSRDRIKSHLIVNNSVYYYRGHKIYQRSIDGISSSLDSDKPFVNHTFNPPYKQYYEVKLAHEDGMLGVIVGSAGYYYINILSLEKQKVMITNISASSSRVSMKGSYVHYIYGGSGKWRLMSFDFSSKDKKEIRKFKTLNSIELLSAYFIFNDSHGLWLEDYNRDIVKVPFDYSIKGKHNGSILLEFEEKVYMVDPAVLRAKLGELKLEVPELFN